MLRYYDILQVVEFDRLYHAHCLPKPDMVVGVIGIELFRSIC
jgi:hypothetical protein